MLKSYRAALLALLLLMAVHLQPVYRVSAAQQQVPGLYTRAQIRQARDAALAAAEELVSGEAVLPALRTSLRLRIRRPDGDTALLSDALLRGVDPVVSADAVRINGTALGTVANGERLLSELRRTIRGDMPADAAVGNLGGRLQIYPVYTRSGLERSAEDMLADILAAAPAFYLDDDGRRVGAA